MSAPVSGMPLHIKCAIARLLPPVAQGRVFCGPAALCLRETRSQWHRHSCLCAFASAARRLGVKILLPACLSVLTASAATATPLLTPPPSPPASRSSPLIQPPGRRFSLPSVSNPSPKPPPAF